MCMRLFITIMARRQPSVLVSAATVYMQTRNRHSFSYESDEVNYIEAIERLKTSTEHAYSSTASKSLTLLHAIGAQLWADLEFFERGAVLAG